MTAGVALARRRHGQRQHWWWWVLMLVVVVVSVVLSTDSSPRSGHSDQRLFALGSQLKCLQCVGESVAGSQAPLAVQFRDEIRSQMRAGNTDDEILNYFADRYGQDVLLNPPTTGFGAAVWVLPVLVVAGALVGLWLTFRRWRTDRTDEHATDDDERRVAAALARRDGEATGEAGGEPGSGA